MFYCFQFGMTSVQQQIQNLLSSPLRGVSEYNALLSKLVQKREMAAVVFVYDMMKRHGVTPNHHTFSLIDRLHSKTVPENRTISVPQLQARSLQPRRRIHKIMKGHQYTHKYDQAVRLHAKAAKAFCKIMAHTSTYGSE